MQDTFWGQRIKECMNILPQDNTRQNIIEKVIISEIEIRFVLNLAHTESYKNKSRYRKLFVDKTLSYQFNKIMQTYFEWEFLAPPPQNLQMVGAPGVQVGH